MSAPDIVALANLGVRTAWELTVSIQVDATVKLAPVSTPAADGGTVTVVWGHTLAGLKLINYDDASEEKDGERTQEGRGSQVKQKLTVFLVRGIDVPAVPNEETQVVVTTGTVTWEVYRVERVPGDSLYILYSRR